MLRIKQVVSEEAQKKAITRDIGSTYMVMESLAPGSH